MLTHVGFMYVSRMANDVEHFFQMLIGSFFFSFFGLESETLLWLQWSSCVQIPGEHIRLAVMSLTLTPVIRV